MSETIPTPTPFPADLDFAIDLDDIRNRLRALNYWLSVATIRNGTQGIDEATFAQAPAAFVSVGNESPGQPAGGTIPQRQRVATSISILFVEPSASALEDEDDQVERVRRQIIRQLFGWTPRNAILPLRYGGYGVRAIGGGLIWGEVRMATDYWLRLPA